MCWFSFCSRSSSHSPVQQSWTHNAQTHDWLSIFSDELFWNFACDGFYKWSPVESYDAQKLPTRTMSHITLSLFSQRSLSEISTNTIMHKTWLETIWVEANHQCYDSERTWCNQNAWWTVLCHSPLPSSYVSASWPRTSQQSFFSFRSMVGWWQGPFSRPQKICAYGHQIPSWCQVHQTKDFLS